MGRASSPITSFLLGIPGNATIAATMAGTAAATAICSSIPCVYAREMEVFNLTGRNLELVVGPDNGTASYTLTTPGTTPVMIVGNGTFFCPGTAAATPGFGRGVRFPITLQQGEKIFARTTENTPITCATTSPLIINLWT